jgi:pseudouridine-5'-phosphate glycosidase
MNQFCELSPEVASALAAGKPVVALESTIISHGMPYPRNLETALRVEAVVRESGATPATIAVIGGKLKAGLSREEIEILARGGRDIIKVSRRDLPRLVAGGLTGATTVAATMIIAELAGIRIFATGGIGGVHRGAESSWDISADLEELGRTSVAVVCAGAKAILDLPKTLEYLETKGVPVVGYRTSELPAFYTSRSGLMLEERVDSPEEAAGLLAAKWGMGLSGGVIFANPIPEAFSMEPAPAKASRREGGRGGA